MPLGMEVYHRNSTDTHNTRNYNSLQLYHFFTLNSPFLHGTLLGSAINPSYSASWPGRFFMQNKIKAGITVLGFVFVSMFAVKASAECGDLTKYKFGASLHQQSWESSQFNRGALLLVADSGDPIVGFWKVTFTSEGTTGIPDGTVVDSAFAQWHSDRTEIMNSSRPPVTQSFCLGVWKKVGGRHYRLNHFAKSFDPNNNPVGPGNIREDVVLSPTGGSFTGTFTIDQYDQAGNTLIHITGEISGTRITVDSPASVAF
jgi:hypothetical protein